MNIMHKKTKKVITQLRHATHGERHIQVSADQVSLN